MMTALAPGCRDQRAVAYDLADDAVLTIPPVAVPERLGDYRR